MSFPKLDILEDDNPTQAQSKRHLNAVFEALDFFARENVLITIKGKATKQKINYSFDLKDVSKRAFRSTLNPQPSTTTPEAA